MKYRNLGAGSLNVSVLSFGAWQIGDPNYWGADAEKDGLEAVHAALDAGINFFDTAEMYGKGESERALGKALSGKRDHAFIASKFWPDHSEPAKLRQACEDSLKRLGTDYLDLYQVHWPSRDVPFEAVYAEMQLLKDEGKIRHIGVSNFGRQDLMSWLGTGSCVSDQLGYNLLFRAIEHEILPACIERNVGVLVYMPLLQGTLSGRWKTIEEIPMLRRRTRHFSSTREGVRHGEPGCEDLLSSALNQLGALADELRQPLATLALAWVIAQPGITSAIIGARDARQLKRNLAAADLDLTPDTLSRLDEITVPIKQQLGSNPDLWLTTTGSRIR
ncbi:MAG: aldo/keto reductase [Candidatus Hydrogenedentes bacterium]|nr:aldo/keto reductase [Candidatus Hydrogenedentota bacterium]